MKTPKLLSLVWLAGVLATIPLTEAKRHRERAKMPSWKDIMNVAVDTLLEDLPEQIEKSGQQLSMSILGGGGLHPSELAYDPDLASLDCDAMVNHLILNFNFNAAFYFLVNGWYLGQLGDYASCRTFSQNGQYILATVNGTYTGDNVFTRGSYGKYMGFSTQMGLCVPEQCSREDITKTIGPLILRYARNAHWENPTVSFQDSMHYVETESRAFSTGKIAAIAVIGVLLLGVVIGSVVELSSIGDNPAYEKEVLDELSRFRSTA